MASGYELPFPSSEDAKRNYAEGNRLYESKDFKGAVSAYSKALDAEPSAAKPLYNRGLAYSCARDYQSAIADFSSVIQLHPKFTEAYYMRGLAYELTRENASALKDYHKALELQPNFAKVRERIPNLEQGASKFAFAEVPKENFSDVAGMDSLKEELRKAIIYPLQHPELTKEYGIKGGGGVLLYGPPGCGKTYIMKATAGEAKVNFIEGKLSELVDKWVGDTEKNIHNLFQFARKNSPAIIFFDEIDALGGKREMAPTSPWYRKAVNALLTEMDGVFSSNENILIVGATNAPWIMDSALKRSGRFGKSVYVPAPDEKSRAEIFKVHLRGKPVDDALDFRKLAKETEDFSSADIATICTDAAKIPWREAMENGKKRKITMDDLLICIKREKSDLGEWYDNARPYVRMGENREIYEDLAKAIAEYDKKRGTTDDSHYR